MIKDKRIKFNSKLFGEISGWTGIVLIQSSTLPTTFARITDPLSPLPPLSMVLLVWFGLFLFLIRAIIQRDLLYIVSNAIGFFFQSILMGLIIFPIVS